MLRLMQGPLVRFVSAFLFMAGTSISRAQNTSTEIPPIIDVHHHAMDNDNGFSIGPMCPNTSKFTASDPKTDGASNLGGCRRSAVQSSIPQRRAST